MKKSWQCLEDKLDKVAGRIIKECAGWKCQRCGRQFPEEYNAKGERIAPGLDWAHVWTRTKRTTRWRLDGASWALCTGCHFYLDANPVEKEAWVRQRIGDEHYNYLRALSNMKWKGDRGMLLRALEYETITMSALKNYGPR